MRRLMMDRWKMMSISDLLFFSLAIILFSTGFCLLFKRAGVQTAADWVVLRGFHLLNPRIHWT